LKDSGDAMIDKKCTRKSAQSGVAALLFILFSAVAMLAATATALREASGAQKLQYAEHVSTQSEMSAWTGVSILSSAIAGLSPSAVLTPNSSVVFSGVQSGISAKYIGLNNGLLVFQVKGTSSGAQTILQAAYKMPTASSSTPKSTITMKAGETLKGNTVITGSIDYSDGGTIKNDLSVSGNLTLSGTVTGLNAVCAIGDVTINSNITVETVCSNSNVALTGSTKVTTINAIGNVLLPGGATQVGTVNSNGKVEITGGSAAGNTINAKGDVLVSGNAKVLNINTEGSINWTSSETASKLNANGSVTYKTSAVTSPTTVTAIGNVILTSAQNVSTDGTTNLVGYWGQGISGILKSQGQLSGTSWGLYGGAVVGSGTVGSAVMPFPTTVNVTVSSGYTVPISTISVPTILPYTQATSAVVDAYPLKSQANFAFTGVDANGNPIVEVKDINGITDGTYVIAKKVVGSNYYGNYLCSHATGTTCDSPIIKVCQAQGNNDYGSCFSYSAGLWTINSETMLPGVAWFDGNLNIGNGKWINSFIATGNISTSGLIWVYAANYPPSTRIEWCIDWKCSDACWGVFWIHLYRWRHQH
jgi:hypothetical protein